VGYLAGGIAKFCGNSAKWHSWRDVSKRSCELLVASFPVVVASREPAVVNFAARLQSWNFSAGLKLEVLFR